MELPAADETQAAFVRPFIGRAPLTATAVPDAPSSEARVTRAVANMEVPAVAWRARSLNVSGMWVRPSR